MTSLQVAVDNVRDVFGVSSFQRLLMCSNFPGSVEARVG